MVVYDLPLNEVVFDFYDRLKSVTKGYASFDYHLDGYREDDLVKMRSSSTTSRSTPSRRWSTAPAPTPAAAPWSRS